MEVETCREDNFFKIKKFKFKISKTEKKKKKSKNIKIFQNQENVFKIGKPFWKSGKPHQNQEFLSKTKKNNFKREKTFTKWDDFFFQNWQFIFKSNKNLFY